MAIFTYYYFFNLDSVTASRNNTSLSTSAKIEPSEGDRKYEDLRSCG